MILTAGLGYGGGLVSRGYGAGTAPPAAAVLGIGRHAAQLAVRTTAADAIRSALLSADRAVAGSAARITLDQTARAASGAATRHTTIVSARPARSSSGRRNTQRGTR